MGTAPNRRARYDNERMFNDLVRRGWEAKDLAQKANVSHMTVSRFLSGQVQTVKMAARLSKALGHPPDHYLLSTTIDSVAAVEAHP